MTEPFLVHLELARTETITGGYRHYDAYLYTHGLSQIRRQEGGSVKLPCRSDLDIPGMQARWTLGEFIDELTAGEGSLTGGGLQVGRWLYKCLFQEDPKLREHWKKAREQWEHEGRPLRLELVLPHPSTSVDPVGLEHLPFELLADETPLFQKPGYTLVRCYGPHTTKTFDIPRGARVLLAWANPKQGSQPIADDVIEGHQAALGATLQEPLGWEVVAPCAHATPESLEERLREVKPQILSLVAHGQEGGGALRLESAGESASLLTPNRLANMCRRGEVRLVMLWACHGAMWRTDMGSLAEALLDPTRGDVAAVIAAHGALEATGTATLAKEMLGALARSEGDLDRALFAARSRLAERSLQWAISPCTTPAPETACRSGAREDRRASRTPSLHSRPSA